MHLDGINRRIGELSGDLRFAQPPTADRKPAANAHDNFQAGNWILDPPDTLLAAKDFHFAITASFRMTESMGSQFLFDEVR